MKQSSDLMEAKLEKHDFKRVLPLLNQNGTQKYEAIERKIRKFLIARAKLLHEPGFAQSKADKLKIKKVNWISVV